MSSIDLGSVTAYSIAVKYGFTGTEAEWMQAILNAGEYSQETAENAELAEASAQSAEASAVRAEILYGSPLVANTVADMEEENRVYVYVGSETGYTSGNWYYYDGTTWTSGGVYNGEGVNTDPSLSIEDMPADAKAVGDAIDDVKSDLSDLEDRVEVLEEGGGSGTGVPAEVKMAIFTLLDSAGYGETGVSDELAIVQAWATTTSSITLNTSEITISGTGTNQLIATTVPSGNPVSWSSSNPNVATVSNTGLVTGVGNGSCVITASSGDVSATCSVSVSGFVMYSITNNLTNATNSNPATSIASGASYSAVITANEGSVLSTAVITMGGIDITSTAYDSGNISIASVTGNIVITVTTSETTDVRLYAEDKVLAYNSPANLVYEKDVTHGGITITYDMDVPTNKLYPAGVLAHDSIFTQNQGEIQVLYDDTPKTYTDISGRWAKTYNSSHTYTEFKYLWNLSFVYNQIRFSVDMRFMDDSYMYDYSTGQVWFAGKNTPYYGMHNIHEADGLTSISAVYSPSSTVYDFTTLDELKTDVVVTAHYLNGTTDTISDFYLLGELEAGTNTITVYYGGKTTTITVIALETTTAKIAEENKVLNYSGGNYTTNDVINGGITITYDMDSPTNILYPAGILAASDSTLNSKNPVLVVYDENDNPVNYVGSGPDRWLQLLSKPPVEYSQQWTLQKNYSKIAFSVDMRCLSDSYMYDKTTGKVWFAGINTPYFGMSNISEANS